MIFKTSKITKNNKILTSFFLIKIITLYIYKFHLVVRIFLYLPNNIQKYKYNFIYYINFINFDKFIFI